MPAAWSDFIENNPSGASSLGPSSALKSGKERYKTVLNTLKDSEKTTFFLVARADAHSIKEAAHTSTELMELGMDNQRLLINGVFNVVDQKDEIAVKKEKMAKTQLSELPEALRSLNITHYPLLPYNILGLEKLRSLVDKNL